MQYTPIEDIVQKNGCYPREAYILVNKALLFTRKKMKRSMVHVSGQELAFGFKDFMNEEYGPMAPFVLEKLNIQETLDIGRIVYIMIEHGLMRKEKEDRLEDFEDAYDFKDAFSG